MGGRGSGSGMSGGSFSALARRLDRTPFVNQGGGQWTLDTGMGGGSILDETGSSRDPGLGFGGKVYSAQAWDSDYNVIGDTEMYSSLNAAKEAVKRKIKSTL